VLRIAGNNYVGDSPLGKLWKDAFEKAQPGIKIEYYLPTAAIAIPRLYFDLADIGINHAPGFYDDLANLRIKGYEPTGISVFTGSYDYVGWQNNMVIIVNAKNPLTHISMKQLDGVFGSLRDGGWVGTEWHPEMRRGADQDIRTWGQLGLTGEWADKPIHVYGYNFKYHFADEFDKKVLKASGKWNEGLRMYSNVAGLKADGSLTAGGELMMNDLSKDPYGIAYTGIPFLTPQTKVLALAPGNSDKYVELNLDNVQNRSYPLLRDVYYYVKRKRGQPLDPKVKEFLRYILSREGQAAVQRDGKYLPLTPEAAREQLKKLD
jgi:phosphate transport system substrate-binding protein